MDVSQTDLKVISRDLNLRLVLLQQKLAVLDELMLHISKKTDASLAEYYVNLMNMYGEFFIAIRSALQSSYLFELHAFLGVSIDKNGCLIQDKYGEVSVYALAVRANKKEQYLDILKKHMDEIDMVFRVRNTIGHLSKLSTDQNQMLIPSYVRAVKFLNEIAKFIMSTHDEVHGIPGYNPPHLMEIGGQSADDAERLIYELSKQFDDADENRKLYLSRREEIHNVTEKELVD